MHCNVIFRGDISHRQAGSMGIHESSIHYNQVAHSLWETGDPGPDLAHPEDGVQEHRGRARDKGTSGSGSLGSLRSRQIPRSWVS